MQDTQYYLNECPQKPNCFYCTARTHNTGVERGYLQYNIDPNILKKNTINYIEDENIVFEENTEENLKKLLPKTNKITNFNDWHLLLVVRMGGDNNWIKGALLNKTTNLLALMTSSKGKDRIIDNGNRPIPSYNPEWFIGHYRLVAPAKFWHELIRRLNTNEGDSDKGVIVVNKKGSTKVPKIKKQEIWSKYIGIDKGREKCLCCNLNDITQFEFHSGHIIPKSKGGDCSIDNLRPICHF